MWKSTLPKTVARWIDANPHIVSDVSIEIDGYGDEQHQGLYSMWVYLKPGYINTRDEVHHMHEGTAKDVLEAKKWIKPCTCNSCWSAAIGPVTGNLDWDNSLITEALK